MNRTRLLSLLLGIVLTIPIAACAAGTAQASPNQISIMQDDDLLVNGSAKKADHALRVMAGMGVEYVRVTVLWSNVARGIKSAAHFNGKDPAAYPHANWDRYDNLVTNAGNDGIGVYLDVTGPGPAFSHTKAPNRYKKYNAAWMPNATQFYRFVAAVGQRYSGSYRKETGSHQLLPRVSFWSLWNEPNQAGWLAPQSIMSPVTHKVIPYAPMAYRRLFQLGRQALTSTGHDRDYIVAGETAPSGRGTPSVNNPLSPVKFIQELLCVNGANVPYTGSAAAARNCSDFAKYGSIKASAWGHHPYTKAIPPETPAKPGDITIANLGTLPGLLDNLAVVTGHISSGLSIVASEFGYETNPPDPFSGTSLVNQAAWINQGDFLAYSTPRVVGMTQFQLRDAGPDRKHPAGSKAYWDTYQSGLLNGAGHQQAGATRRTCCRSCPTRGQRPGDRRCADRLLGPAAVPAAQLWRPHDAADRPVQVPGDRTRRTGSRTDRRSRSPTATTSSSGRSPTRGRARWRRRGPHTCRRSGRAAGRFPFRIPVPPASSRSGGPAVTGRGARVGEGRAS